MPSNYTGRASRVAQGQVPVIACPVGTDAPNAASVNHPLQTLADFVAFLQHYTATVGAAQPNAETLVVNGNPALGTYKSLAAGARVCLWETIVTVGASKFTARIYLTAAGAMELVHNCLWDGPSALWKADPTNTETTFFKAVVAGNGGPALFAVANTAAGWPDSAWAPIAKLSNGLGGLSLTDGVLALVGTTTGAAGSNPPASTAVANAVCAKNTCKAWGSLSLGYTGVAVDEGFNVASLTVVNLGKDFFNNDLWAARVTFAAPMQSAKYSVSLTMRDTSRPDLVHVPCVYAKAAGYFDIVLRQPGQQHFDDPGMLSVGVDFQVFGRQDS
jgi:hypothetical protein